jgi:hypothetical protein
MGTGNTISPYDAFKVLYCSRFVVKNLSGKNAHYGISYIYRQILALVFGSVKYIIPIATNKDLAVRIGKLEHGQRQTASIIEVLVDEIDKMKTPLASPRRRIGFD